MFLMMDQEQQGREANSLRFIQVFKYFLSFYTDFKQEWVRELPLDLRFSCIQSGEGVFLLLRMQFQQLSQGYSEVSSF